MASRPYWKGFLKLSLVTCPVALYPASSQADKTRFHQINVKTGNRLRQQMVDERTGKVVEGADKGRGYELTKGKYVQIDPEDLEAVEAESIRTIDIESFVPEEEIDKRFYERPYYVVPNGKGGEEAFAVIRDAMKDKSRVALARIVFAGREHIITLEPWDKGILATTLRYDNEVRDEEQFFKSIPSPRVDKEMIELARDILDRKAGHFDTAKFKDEYELALRKLVKRKAAGKTIELPETSERPSNVIDLMEALQQSLSAKGGRKKANKTKTKAPPRRRKSA